MLTFFLNQLNNFQHQVKDSMSGTTAISVGFHAGRVTISNVGDSRAVLGYRVEDRLDAGATPVEEEKVEIGEETGELPDMLTRIADNYDEDVDNAVAGVTSLIEPVMIVFLAVVVGFIVIALFLPIVAIIETIGK